MKKILLLLAVFACIAFLYFFLNTSSSKQKSANFNSANQPSSPSVPLGQKKTSLFIPYWTLESNMPIEPSIDRVIYFGVAAGEMGVDMEEPGYRQIETFIEKVGTREKYLALRMINSDINFKILRDKNVQDELISQSIEIAQQYGFEGIVLDLETSSLSFDSVINRISNFMQTFYKEASSNNLKFAIATYGDVFYRSRPFDMEVLGKNSDEILIMAYDFHKARGNPGPNFPLSGRDEYGYDFEQMIKEYVDVVPREKITVIFGLFGYDWAVDSENRAIGSGVPLAAIDIDKKFVKNCAFKNCTVNKNETTGETKITYIDSDAQSHVVWFEDFSSIKKKEEVLQKNGINSTAFWAHSYY